MQVRGTMDSDTRLLLGDRLCNGWASVHSRGSGSVVIRLANAKTIMLARFKHVLWVCSFLLFGLPLTLGLGSGIALAQTRPGLDRAVAEIHFGVIEPPVVAQKDITVCAPGSTQHTEEKPLECSGMAWANGRLILTSDRHGLSLFSCPIDLDRMTIGAPSPHVVIANEQELLDDAECMVIRRDIRREHVVYVMCSLSNDPDELPLPKRRHMLRLPLRDLDPSRVPRGVVLSAGKVRDLIGERFEAVGIEPYRTYNADFSGSEKNTYRWGNVEGMCFTPDGRRLLLGMRNPLLGAYALMAVVEGIDEAFDARDANSLCLTDLFAVDLGGRGVSDLCWDPVTKGFLIAAAKSNGPKLSQDQPFPPNTLDSALFWWNGNKQDRPIAVALFPDMKVEAVCRLGRTRYIAVGSDEGDVSEGRPEQRQSVVTIMYFTGIDVGDRDGADATQR